MARIMNANEFQKKVFDTVSSGYACLSLALGQELGLFDHVTSVPQTAAQIASSAGYKQRYTEEWLKCMAISGFIEVSEDGTEFWIPDDHRPYLSKTEPALAFNAYLPIMAGCFYQVKECFKKDGPLGIPDSSYHKPSNMVSGISDLYQLHESFIPTYFGTVPKIVEQFGNGGRYLDVSCKRGNASYIVAKAFPKCQSFGIDKLDASIEYANSRAAKENLKNLHYLVGDATKMPLEWSNTFDYVTIFDDLHEQFFPEKVVGEIFRIVKPGGYFSIIEVNASSNVKVNKSWKLGRIVENISLFYCLPVASQVEGAAGLGAMAGIEVFLNMAKKAGFIEVKVERIAAVENLNALCIFQKPV